MTPRFLPDCFELYSRTVERYGAKRLPAHHAIRDWGITYAELEPYLHARRSAARDLREKAGLNPFEGPRSSEFPTPPQKLAYFPSLIAAGARSLGYHPSPMPSANLSTAYRNPDGIVRPACQYCGFCERSAVWWAAKAQPTNTLLPVIARQKGVTIRTGADVRRILYRGGRATGVLYRDASGEEVFQPADVALLASWTLNNTRLLLLSKIGEPYDPSTGWGWWGATSLTRLPPA